MIDIDDDNPEHAVAKVQGICDALHELCTQDREQIIAMSVRVNEMLDGLPLYIGIGLAVQVMLNSSHQYADSVVSDEADQHNEFCYIVSAACMMAQYTAQAAEQSPLVQGGIQ